MQARKVAKTLNWVATAAAAWAWLFPRPYVLVVATLAFLPWLSILLVARSRGKYLILSRRKDPHPGLDALSLLPGLALASLAILYLHVVDWRPALAVAVIGALALTAAHWAIDNALRLRPALLFFLLLPNGAYAYGAVVEANALLDRGPAKVFEARVVNKRVSTGRYSTTWHVELGPWGPIQQAGEVSVPRALYDSVQIGGQVCALLQKGAVGIPWYYLAACRRP